MAHSLIQMFPMPFVIYLVMKLLNLLHYIPADEDEGKKEAVIRSKQDILRMASETFGLMSPPYFNYDTFRGLNIPQLIQISHELNGLSGTILVSQDTIRQLSNLDTIDALILFVNTLDERCRLAQLDKNIVIHNLIDAMNRVLSVGLGLD